MKKFFLFTFIIGVAYFAAPQQEAKAFEPVTMALLAPVALQVAQTATPYIIKGLMNVGKSFMRMGVDLIDFFRLPLGIFQCTFLAPFGQVGSGVTNIFKGGIAPFKLCLRAVTLPVAACGANLNF